MVAPVNDAIAGKLREMAEVLEQQQADVFRIAAYRRAADTLEMLRQPVEQIVRIEGLPGLVELPGIGRGIGSAIVEMVTAGRWSQLERLQGELQPEQLFQTLPRGSPGKRLRHRTSASRRHPSRDRRTARPPIHSAPPPVE
ncbi:MAG TPA: helix-hairpin-helix domain-containing protein, partial [Mesorhizobium sp.]|nr:helix-hairpin-helix domain-containing protein [Mesorhizobium sp.]